MYRMNVEDGKFPENNFSSYNDMYSQLRMLEETYGKEFVVANFDALNVANGREIILLCGNDHKVSISIHQES